MTLQENIQQFSELAPKYEEAILKGKSSQDAKVIYKKASAILRKIKSEDPSFESLKPLLNSEESFVRLWAAGSLSQLGDESAIATLNSLAVGDGLEATFARTIIEDITR